MKAVPEMAKMAFNGIGGNDAANAGAFLSGMAVTSIGGGLKLASGAMVATAAGTGAAAGELLGAITTARKTLCPSIQAAWTHTPTTNRTNSIKKRQKAKASTMSSAIRERARTQPLMLHNRLRTHLHSEMTEVQSILPNLTTKTNKEARISNWRKTGWRPG